MAARYGAANPVPLESHGDSRLLARAVDEPDADVATSALSLLGASTEPRAMDILFDALRVSAIPLRASRCTSSGRPVLIAGRLKAQLHDRDPWSGCGCATLLARYPEEPSKPISRRSPTTPIHGCARRRSRHSARSAMSWPQIELKLLRRFVRLRAGACRRALGELARADLADHVAPLLGRFRLVGAARR